MPKRKETVRNHRDDIVQVAVTLESRRIRNHGMEEAFKTISIKVRLHAIEAGLYVERVRKAVREMATTAAGKDGWFESSIEEVQPKARSSNGSE